MEDLDEYIEYLALLTKSADVTVREYARDGLARVALADLEKVGPKGYIHGWIFVGPQAVGTRVFHPHHGHGTVSRSGKRTAGVQFDSGHYAAFEHKPHEPSAGHFVERARKPRAPKPTGRDLKTEQDTRIRAATRRGPLTDREFAKRQKTVEKSIGSARKTLSTDITHAHDGAWNPDRDQLHRDIADHLYAQAAHVPNEGHAVIAGGLGGAGKTTVLRDHAGIDPKKYLTINPDDIKEEMAARGLIPEVSGHPELTPMERAALVHEESSRIAKLLADKAYRDKKNVIWDITMSSGPSVQSRIDDLQRHGYTKTQGVFVDIPVETSVSRAMARYRRGIDDWHKGKGHGGRFVPPSVIRAQQTSTGRTVNREVFDGMRGAFTDWSVYDNSVDGRAPVLVQASGAKKGKKWRR